MRLPFRSRLIALVAVLALGGTGVVIAAPLPTTTTSAATPDLPLVDDNRCDPIDPAHCLLPFPNDFFTVPDQAMPSGRRVNLDPLSMPRNVAGKPIVPVEWNRNDGFSPGSMVLARVPGLDLHRTWGTARDHIEDIGRYNKKDAPIVIVNTRTGKRHPFWSELDTHPDTTDDRRALILRPAVNFEEGTRYVVALRDMKDASGETIPPSDAFAAYRDGTAPSTPSPFFEARRPAMEQIFTDLANAKKSVARDDLYLAWDFTVASGENIAGRVLHMRDDAFGRILGDTNLADGVVAGDSPDFTVTRVTEQGGHSSRRVEGRLTVPNYLTHQATTDQGDGYQALSPPGSRLFYANPLDQHPTQNPVQQTIDVDFVCTLPATASAATPARPMLYGHGLLGARGESTGSSTEDMRIRGFAPCAVDWMGMAFSDLPNVASILPDVSNFPSLADRAQQGFLNFMYLGRALIHGDGLAADPAFRDAEGNPLLRTDELFYDGNSQGGIMGGALTALAPDFTKAVLGVPAINYSTLLNRSVDWEGDFDPLAEPDIPPYSWPFYQAYPDKLEQQVIFGLMQMLWDRAEGNGYAQHMTTDPYPNTPPHQVMLQVAFADHQVANVAAEVEGRTIGADMHWPALPDDLHWSVEPDFGFDHAQFEVPGGSYLVYWWSADRGLKTPPNGNVPPTAGEDPHGDPRKDNAGSDQKAAFLVEGLLRDVCAGPCITTDATRRN